jgi:hypothetical protein
MMRVLLKDLKNTESFIDDILIHTEIWEEHILCFGALLERLRSGRLSAKSSECYVGFTFLEFLGHLVGDGVMKPNTEELEAIKNAPCHDTKKKVRSFLGLIGYYCKYVPNFATIVCPLTELTKKVLLIKLSDAKSTRGRFSR